MIDLKTLCSYNAVSGNENKLSNYIFNELKTNFKDVFIDKRGNVICSINNNKKINVLLDAHIDQIGLVVSDITKDGFIKFIANGGVDLKILPTSEVTIHGKEDVFGVIGAKPPHLQNNGDENNASKISNLYIDCGYSYEHISKLVSIGDTISLNANFDSLKNNYYTSKSLDNRVGVYVIYKCLERLNNSNTNYNIIGSFSVKEEIGTNDVFNNLCNLNPDICIVVDVTFGISPNTSKENGFETSKGITIAKGPSLDLELSNKIKSVCDKHNIPFFTEVCSGSTGTNVWKIQENSPNTRCILVSVPIKYMHSTVEVVNHNDIDYAINSICLALEEGVF